MYTQMSMEDTCHNANVPEMMTPNEVEYGTRKRGIGEGVSCDNVKFDT